MTITNNTLSKIIIFTVGATIGSAVTWGVLKKRYEKMTREDIQSVKEYYAMKYGEKHDNTRDDESDDKDEYDKIIEGEGYLKGKEEDEEMVEPYVISPDEFGEEGYETETLWYYTDGVVADDCKEIIEDVDGLIGEDSLNHFGEYEDDSVFVRSDNLKTDFEILKEYRAFSEIK